MLNNYTLIIPNAISAAFRKATIPNFPSDLMRLSEESLLYAEYSGCDFAVWLELSWEGLQKYHLSRADIKKLDTRFQHAIGCWLISKRSKQPGPTVKGNVRELADDILGWKQIVRESDRKKILINLKGLAWSTYNVTFKKPIRKQEFNLVRDFFYEDSNGDFECTLDDSIPQVVPEKHLIEKKPLTTYTSKRLKDIYPKQPRYRFNMRQYLTGIKNNKKDIPQTRGETLLEQFGYMADCNSGEKAYRNSVAQKLINEYIKLAKTYGLDVSVIKRFKDSKTVSKKYYLTKVRRKHEGQGIPAEEKEKLMGELTRLIQLEPGFNDKIISQNKATNILNEYGPNTIKDLLDSEPINTINDLIVLLGADCEN